MDRSKELKKMRQELAEVKIPSRLDTTLNRCFARVSEEQGEMNKMSKINMMKRKKFATAALSAFAVLSIGTISYAAVKGGFFNMIGADENDQAKLTEYVSTQEASNVIAGYEITVENTMADYENGMGYTYFSIENTKENNDYTLLLRTTSLTEEEEAAMAKDNTKYVTPILDASAQSITVDEAKSTDTKKYILISYSIDNADEDVDLLLSECDMDGGIETGVNETLGSIRLPKANSVEKKTFKSAEGKEITLSPMALAVTDENVESYNDAANAIEDDSFDAPDLVDLYIKDIKLVTNDGKEITGDSFIKKGLSKTDVFGATEGEVKLDDVDLTFSFANIIDNDDIAKIVIGNTTYELAR